MTIYQSLLMTKQQQKQLIILFRRRKLKASHNFSKEKQNIQMFPKKDPKVHQNKTTNAVIIQQRQTEHLAKINKH